MHILGPYSRLGYIWGRQKGKLTKCRGTEKTLGIGTELEYLKVSSSAVKLEFGLQEKSFYYYKFQKNRAFSWKM